MTMDTVTKGPQRINDLELIIQLYAYLYSKLDTEPDTCRRSKRMRQETAVDHVVEGIRLVRGSTTREIASMFFGRMRDPKHRLAKESIPLVSLDYGIPGPPLVICHYDPASLRVDTVVSHSPSVGPRDSTPPPKTAPVMAQPSGKPPLSWSAGRVKHLVNRLCYSIESDKRILRDAETALRNKWDQMSKFDIPATVKKLQEYGYFKAQTVTHRNETFTALVLQKTADEIVDDLRKRGELSEDNGTRTSLAPEAPAAPNRLAPKTTADRTEEVAASPELKPAPTDPPAPPPPPREPALSATPTKKPEPPAPRPAPATTVAEHPAKTASTSGKTVRVAGAQRGDSNPAQSRDRDEVATEQRAAYVLPAEEEFARALRLLVTRHGVGYIASAADLFGTGALSQEQMVIIGRFCDAELLRTVRGGWQIVYDVRRLVCVRIEERRAIHSSKNRQHQLELLRQVWETESENGVTNKKKFLAVCAEVIGLQANSLEAYYYGNRANAGSTFSLGILIPMPNDSSRCYLAPESLSGSDSVRGTQTVKSPLLLDKNREDRIHLQAIAKKYVAIASREREPLPFEGQTQPAAKPEPAPVAAPPPAPPAPAETPGPVEATVEAAADAVPEPAVEEAPAPVELEAVAPTLEPTAGEAPSVPAPVEEVPAPTTPAATMEVVPETPPPPVPEPVVSESVQPEPEPPVTDSASLRATMRVPAPVAEDATETLREALSAQCQTLIDSAKALEKEAVAKRQRAAELRPEADDLEASAKTNERSATDLRHQVKTLQDRLRRLAEIEAERQAILSELAGALPKASS